MRQYILDAAALVIACVVVMMSAVLFSLLPKLVPGPQSSSGARRRGSTAAPRGVKRYLPFSTELAGDDVLVVDCTHPTAPTLTHHKNSRNPPLSAGALLQGTTLITCCMLLVSCAAASRPLSASGFAIRRDLPFPVCVNSAVPGADTSTGLVLNALRSAAASPGSSLALSKWLDTRYVTVNHFDGEQGFKFVLLCNYTGPEAAM